MMELTKHTHNVNEYEENIRKIKSLEERECEICI